MHYSRYLMIPAAMMLLAACEPQMDMQGVDPNDYYAEHPIKNRVITRNESYEIYVAPNTASLSPQETEMLHTVLHDVSPPSVETIQIHLAETGKLGHKLQASLTKELSHMGFAAQNVVFTSSPASQRDHIRLDVRYAAVIAPDCPDWRTSPVTTYSNTWQGNFRCAGVVNLGMMVADPHDLVRGTGDVTPDVVRDSAVIQNYRNGSSGSPAAAPNSSYQVNTSTTSAGTGAMGGDSGQANTLP